MNIVRIPKGNGKFRTIYAPDPERKEKCREVLYAILNPAVALNDRHGVQHGFRAARSPVTNALAHVGWAYTLKFDLKDFFDSVTPGHVRSFFAPNGRPTKNQSRVEMQCFEDGAARQGLPSSPAVANLAASPMDNEIMALQVKGRFTNFVYTRYADDLTFSFAHPSMAALLMEQMPKIAERHGFKINEGKTRLQCSRAGARRITGVTVGSYGITAPREVKRRLRAMRHQQSINPTRKRQCQIEGLEEWARLRLPNGYTAHKSIVGTIVPQHSVAVSPSIHTGPYIRKFA